METAPKRINWKIIIVMFGASLFLGIAIFTALVGAFFPAINNISRPLLCDGEYNITTTRGPVKQHGRTISTAMAGILQFHPYL